MPGLAAIKDTDGASGLGQAPGDTKTNDPGADDHRLGAMEGKSSRCG